METTQDPAPTTPLAIEPNQLTATSLPSVPGYEVLGLIGRGGMGRVYRARHLTLGRIVAIKLLSHEPDEYHIARFREEIRAVARLQHPNIAQLFETGVADGQPYFTQEFLDGGSLAQSFDKKPQVPVVAARLVETIARAIQHSHDHNILHRDLKPANILLTGDGSPKVTDFGLAKTVSPVDAAGSTATMGVGLTHTGEILGTPAYMPPEQASGILSELGPPADVYGLGAILYEALTGRPPFLAPDAIRTVMMVREMDPVSPRTLQPEVPRDLETICLKCLAKAPRKRYASAAELAEDLRRFQAREPILARPVSWWEHTTKWARRRPWQAAAAVLGVLLVAGLAVGSTVVAEQNRKVNQANATLSAVNAELENTNTRLDAAKVFAEAEKLKADRTLWLALGALNQYFFTISDRLKEIPQGEKLRLDVLRQAQGTLDDLSKFQPDDPNLQRFRMEGYDRLGNIESQQGNSAGAEANYVKAKSLATALEVRFPHEVGYTRDRILATVKLADLQLQRGDTKAADTQVDSILPELKALVLAHPEDISVLELESLLQHQLLQREMRLGHWDGVEAQLRRLCDLQRRLAKVNTENPARMLAVIDADRLLAVFLVDFEKLDAASVILNEAARNVSRLPEPISLNARKLRASLAVTVGSYLQRRSAKYPAFVAYVAALREYDLLAKDFPETPLFAFQQAKPLWMLAPIALSLGDGNLAIRYLERSRNLLSRLTKEYPGDSSYRELHDRVVGLLKPGKPGVK